MSENKKKVDRVERGGMDGKWGAARYSSENCFDRINELHSEITNMIKHIVFLPFPSRADMVRLMCLSLFAVSAVHAATKPAKESAAPYCPPGQSVVDVKSPELAGIRRTAMAFAKLDFEWSRGGPMEWKYRKLVVPAAVGQYGEIFPSRLDFAAIRGYRWHHACVGHQEATAWIKIDLAYLWVSTPVSVRPKAIHTSQHYYDPQSWARLNPLENATLLHRYPRKNGEYEDYLEPPQRYYLQVLPLVSVDGQWLINAPKQIRTHRRIETVKEEHHRKAQMDKKYLSDQSELYRWNEHDEAILQMIARLTKPAFRN